MSILKNECIEISFFISDINIEHIEDLKSCTIQALIKQMKNIDVQKLVITFLLKNGHFRLQK